MKTWTAVCPHCGAGNDVPAEAVRVECGSVDCHSPCANCGADFKLEGSTGAGSASARHRRPATSQSGTRTAKVASTPEPGPGRPRGLAPRPPNRSTARPGSHSDDTPFHPTSIPLSPWR